MRPGYVNLKIVPGNNIPKEAKTNTRSEKLKST